MVMKASSLICGPWMPRVEVSSTSFGIALDPTQATAQDRVMIGPFTWGGGAKLSDLWVNGTATQKLMVLGIPF